MVKIQELNLSVMIFALSNWLKKLSLWLISKVAKFYSVVEDDGSVSGIQRENLEEWMMNVFRDKIHPTAELPSGLVEPNAETMQAIYDAENNINLYRYSNIDGLKTDLGW